MLVGLGIWEVIRYFGFQTLLGFHKIFHWYLTRMPLVVAVQRGAETPALRSQSSLPCTNSDLQSPPSSPRNNAETPLNPLFFLQRSCVFELAARRASSSPRQPHPCSVHPSLHPSVHPSVPVLPLPHRLPGNAECTSWKKTLSEICSGQLSKSMLT